MAKCPNCKRSFQESGNIVENNPDSNKAEEHFFILRCPYCSEVF